MKFLIYMVCMLNVSRVRKIWISFLQQLTFVNGTCDQAMQLQLFPSYS